MNKKLLVSIGIFSGLLLLSEVTFADELRESLELYLADPSLDFLGHEFEKILFDESQQAFKGMELNDAEFIAKLKFIIDDIKTMPLQAQAYYKIFTNKVNILAYGSLSGLWGLKSALGPKEFGNVMFKILKLVAK